MGQAATHRGQRIHGGSRPLIARPNAKHQTSPREARVTSRCLVAAVVLCAALSGPALAADSVDAAVAAPVAAVHADGPPVTPRISSTMPSRVRDKLESAFQLAVERVREVPECNGLFNRLDTDGVETLRTTHYYPANLILENQTFRGASAFTQVGWTVTYLCRRFSSLSDRRAAMLVIHEALHHAGLTEAPADPDGLRPREINKMVASACGL
jgi:hypothetical protein